MCVFFFFVHFFLLHYFVHSSPVFCMCNKYRRYIALHFINNLVFYKIITCAIFIEISCTVGLPNQIAANECWHGEHSSDLRQSPPTIPEKKCFNCTHRHYVKYVCLILWQTGESSQLENRHFPMN